MTGKIGKLLTQTMIYSRFSSITGIQYLSVKHSIDRLHPTKKSILNFFRNNNKFKLNISQVI
jgi:hypothetical protein